MERERIKSKTVGKNGLIGLRDQMSEFVRINFDLLYEGAVRLGFNIPQDYWAPKRVQIGETRLNECQGLKYAHGHKYSEEGAPSEEQLRKTVADIQQLIDAASINIEAPFILHIVESGK